MGKELNIEVGAEMMSAIHISEEKNIPLSLVDREVNITIKRVWRSLGFWQKLKLTSQLFASLFFTPQVQAEEVEKMKKKDVLSALMDEIATSFPQIKKTLIDERDEYLAGKIFQTSGKKILAVVGIGHQEGILAKIKSYSKQNLPNFSKLEKIPSVRKITFTTILKWLIPATILSMFIYSFFYFDKDLSLKLLWNWFLVNSIPAFLGASLANASWWTRLCAFFAAPFTSLNPLLSAGLVAGLLETWINKPKVKDFDSLAEDMLSFKKMKKNLISRILLVVILTNLGSALGTFVGIPLLGFLLG